MIEYKYTCDNCGAVETTEKCENTNYRTITVWTGYKGYTWVDTGHDNNEPRRELYLCPDCLKKLGFRIEENPDPRRDNRRVIDLDKLFDMFEHLAEEV